MATLTRTVLSGAPTGNEMIPVAATSNPGTTIHTAHATLLDAMYIWVSNVTGSPATLSVTVETDAMPTDPSDFFVKNLPIRANSVPIPIMTGQTFTGSVIIKAYSGTASALNISGFATRITP